MVHDLVRQTMGKSRAARREKRKEKREIAQATRDTKYKNQKGSIGKKRRRLGAAPSPRAMDALSRRREEEEDNDSDMVVIRNGEAMRSSGGSGARVQPMLEPSDGGDDDDAEPERFSSEEKKLRALKKKLRAIDALKRKRKQGLELDAHQQAKLRVEPEVLRLISHFGASCCAEADAQRKESGQQVVLEGDPPAPSASSTLKQRREQKRLRRLERLRRA